ncbi:YifB family Mg chelatase-like AAA ATPase [Brucepastera parasyntrophica]|uniref:YifB family Mg chelatase-like AAA ATPase n=1 Tax=Brucepastera parasyntrophica TaxID=2880008 RepID=UPI00210D5363|nr:YifB family Mg chelatase-like AAA ATPase [Brucepastera parasyntrophica]ULQ59167.1 YifB family Mg chelatase-like AAA ATPase [Brucepastera parasyntrophica]
MEITSFALFGYEGEIVKVETDLRRGIPAIDIVGLPDGAVKEARERMRAAIINSGLAFPRERVLINLSPADLKKEGSSFDLPIALSVLSAAEGPALPADRSAIMVLGELELSGKVRPVKGVLAAVTLGARRGISRYIVPADNAAEAFICGGVRIAGVKTLGEAVAAMNGFSGPDNLRQNVYENSPGKREKDFCVKWTDAGPHFSGFEEIRGQAQLVRALQIAAAGGHHLLAYGPPGSGKTLAIQHFPLLLPEMDYKTALAVTRIHSIAGTLRQETLFSDADQDCLPGNMLIKIPPFRQPHPGASLEGMVGGGKGCGPGEISLAHGGVLFLDEAVQFKASVLQALRTPVETGFVTVSRAGKSCLYPAAFQLIMAINPCPCGNFAAPGRVCICSPDIIQRYWKRLTAPLLDRVDLRIQVPVPQADSLAGFPSVSTDTLREGIERARRLQWERNRADKNTENGNGWLNAAFSPHEIGRFCRLQPDVQLYFTERIKKECYSGRGSHGILKVARTIADMEKSEK